MSIKRLSYTLLLYFIFPIVLLRLLIQSRSNPDYRKRWSERLGFVSDNLKVSQHKLANKPIIWLHAVSVGEAIAAKPLVQELLNKFPTYRVLITTTTPTGSDRVESMFADEIQDGHLIHTYFPYDLLGSVSRFIRVIKPQILIIVETEIWPNLYAKCYKKDIPIMMVNARLSDKSTKSYLKIKGLVSETLSRVSLIAVRSKSDSERFIKLGAEFNQIKEIGNIKYDISIDEDQLKKSKQWLNILFTNGNKDRLIFVAASTHEGEDSKLLYVYQALLNHFPNLLLVLVPRHPERFDSVYDDCVKLLPNEFKIIRRSDFTDIEKTTYQGIQKTNVILGDTMGEVQMWFALADIVFIGGSLVKKGGHNPLEAILFGLPVISGEHMFNFEDIALDLSKNDLLQSSKDEFELTKKLEQQLNIIKSSKKIEPMYKVEAEKFMNQHKGVTTNLSRLISIQLNK